MRPPIAALLFAGAAVALAACKPVREARGWDLRDAGHAPLRGLLAEDPDKARRINAAIPKVDAAVAVARPFVLQAASADRVRAEHCLAQAVYYEAGDQSLQGEAAVAQTVLNRLRHPDFPKSVCGVVYQGARLATGCQYSFTCDGALARGADAAGWARAQGVARRALAGYVEPSVGWATHYHADYVTPYWRSSLVKLTQIGAHIFYRWPGSAGAPEAFVGRYGGREAYLPPAVLTEGDPADLLAAATLTHQDRQVTLDVAGDVHTYSVADPRAPGGIKTRVAGQLIPSRPQPTPEQAADINATLETPEAAQSSAPPAKP